MPNTPNQTPSTQNKKHARKAKHQVRQKTPSTPSKTRLGFKCQSFSVSGFNCQ